MDFGNQELKTANENLNKKLAEIQQNAESGVDVKKIEHII